MNLKVK